MSEEIIDSRLWQFRVKAFKRNNTARMNTRYESNEAVTTGNLSLGNRSRVPFCGV
jgi:hypothetical protein